MLSGAASAANKACVIYSFTSSELGFLDGHGVTGSRYWTGLDTFQFNGTVWYEADFRNHENASLRLQYEADDDGLSHLS